MVGGQAAEAMQMMAVAVNAGLTKAELDRTMPLHPTSAEEFIDIQETTLLDQPVPPCWMAN
jgi:glutathione reductase (NADPH)